MERLRGLRAVLCSRNEHKRRELEAALPDWTIELLDAQAFPAEHGETYHANAAAKARFGRELADVGVWVLGEDSGIEVEALGGEPGVHSACWSERPVEQLLDRLRGVTDRRVRYVCELVAISPDGRQLRGTGVLEGRIASEPRGSEGFGYDPIFVPDGEAQTVAELGDGWKAEHSHRARAAQALRGALPPA